MGKDDNNFYDNIEKLLLKSNSSMKDVCNGLKMIANRLSSIYPELSSSYNKCERYILETFTYFNDSYNSIVSEVDNYNFVSRNLSNDFEEELSKLSDMFDKIGL